MGTRIVITRAAAARRGLSAVGFSIDIAGTGLMGGVFPDKETYVSLAGPPGGPLFVDIKPIPAGAGSSDDLKLLKDVVRRAFAANHHQPLSFGPDGALEVAGEDRPAVMFYASQNHPLTAVAACAVLVRDGAVGMVVIAGCGGTPEFMPEVLAVASHPSLGHVLETLELGDFAAEPEPEPVASDELDGNLDGMDVEEADEKAPEPVAPEPPPGLSAAHAIALISEVQQVMQRSGLWHDGTPDVSSYATMSPAKQMTWSLQSSLPSIAQSLTHVRGTDGEANAVSGILQMFGAWPEMLRAYPEASALVAVLERGPKV